MLKPKRQHHKCPNKGTGQPAHGQLNMYLGGKTISTPKETKGPFLLEKVWPLIDALWRDGESAESLWRGPQAGEAVAERHQALLRQVPPRKLR